MKIYSITLSSVIALSVLLLYCCSSDNSDESPKNSITKKHPLIIAYPGTIRSVENNYVTFYNNTVLSYDDGKVRNFKQKLDNSSIKDMFSQVYIPGALRIPNNNEDPGRFRNHDFFNTMYGETINQIEKNLVTIIWMPGISGKKLRVTKVNNVDKHLQNVSDKLMLLSDSFHKYVDNPAGTYVYRKIAGTDRLSAHSYGIAIDINLDYSHYWRWDKHKDPDNIIYKNLIPEEIVKVFESEGFIWGGRWYHYDTMHFEYRPELLTDKTNL
ncbi:MAG: M15 family metallopeptidase [Spirochaetes bacterium]|nr:M15 family metallopeptidase [Spirochaetota bacterium]MBN2769176.1 M15 family metallopeptidase [Spirochaetota bacterium]